MVFLLLFYIEKNRYLFFWFISWACFSVALVLRAADALGFNFQGLDELSIAFIYFNSVFMLMGGLSFLNSKKQRNALIILIIFAILLILMDAVSIYDRYISHTVFILSAFIYAYTGIKLYKNTKDMGYGGKIAGITLFIWGVHKADYTLIEQMQWFVPLGYHIAVALTLITAVSIVLMHFEKVKVDRKQEEFLFKNVAEASKDIVFIVRYTPNMHVDFISPAVEKITGYTPDEIMESRDLQNRFVLDYMIKAHGITNIMSSGLESNMHNTQSKSSKDIMLQYSYTDYFAMDGKLEKTVGFIKDVTQDVLALDQIIVRQDWYDALFHKSSTIQLLVSMETGYIVDANQAFLQSYGFEPSELEGMHFRKIFDNKSDSEIFMNSNKPTPVSKVVKHNNKNGGVINVHLTSFPVKFKNSNYLYISIMDVSNEVRFSTALQNITNQHSAILKSLSEGVIGVDVDGDIFFMNSFAADKLGMEEDIIGINLNDIIIKDKDSGTKFDLPELPSFKLLSSSDFEVTNRQHLLNRNGQAIPVEMTMRMLNTYDGDQKFVLVFRDITKELENEESMLRQIQENEVLLQEVHHRVKNNLQIICSLLSLQADRLDDNEPKKYLDSSVARIKSMSLIHELLYQTKGLNAINLKQYIEKLIFDISSTLSFENEITFITDIQDMTISLDKAVPCGLIITELITNSIKHAYPEDTQDKQIEIRFKTDDESSTLCIKDNGVGIDTEFSSDSLGLTVVNSLVRQLRGNISFKNENGLAVKIELPSEFRN
jgi:PAS domain S-box-containing protein